VAIYILFCVIVSISATAFLPDYTNRDISQEDAYTAAPETVISAGPSPVVSAN
jgi:hypothetical protein